MTGTENAIATQKPKLKIPWRKLAIVLVILVFAALACSNYYLYSLQITTQKELHKLRADMNNSDVQNLSTDIEDVKTKVSDLENKTNDIESSVSDVDNRLKEQEDLTHNIDQAIRFNLPY